MRPSINKQGENIRKLDIFNTPDAFEKARNKIKKVLLDKKKTATTNEKKNIDEYIENGHDPKYILGLKNSSAKSKFIMPYVNAVKELVDIEKDLHYNQNNRKATRYIKNPTLTAIYKRETDHLMNGLKEFKNDKESVDILKELLLNFNQVVNMSYYKKRVSKVLVKFQVGKEALLSQAAIALSDKVSRIVSRNIVNNMVR